MPQPPRRRGGPRCRGCAGEELWPSEIHVVLRQSPLLRRELAFRSVFVSLPAQKRPAEVKPIPRGGSWRFKVAATQRGLCFFASIPPLRRTAQGMQCVDLTPNQIQSAIQVGAPAQARTPAPAARGQTANATAGAATPTTPHANLPRHQIQSAFQVGAPAQARTPATAARVGPNCQCYSWRSGPPPTGRAACSRHPSAYS